MRRVSLFRFFVLMFLEVAAANMAHPVTPTFLKELQLPEYMFGVAFAAMSLTNFLFCPFWGTAGDGIGRVKTLVITITGYAAGQLLFAESTEVWQILLARMVSGAFSGGCTVCLMAYVTDTAEPKHWGKYMSISAALTAAATAIGYLTGGVLGDISVATAFRWQIGVLCFVAAGMYLTLADGSYYQRHKENLLRAANPLSVFLDNRKMLAYSMSVFLVTVFMACFASTAYENTFNYYLKDQFHFPPSYNGYIYAAIGVVGILVNMTLGLWLQHNTGCRIPLAVIFSAAGILLISSLRISQMGTYLGANMMIYLCNAMYLPLQQVLIVRQWRGDHGVISGMFSSVRAAGMVCGSLFAGLLYEISPQLTMGACACVYFAAAAMNLYNLKQVGGKRK